MDKIWTKDFILVSTANFLTTFSYYAILVVLAVYAMDEMDASPAEAGLAVGIFLIATLIARLISGRYMEDIGRSRLMRIGIGMFALVMALYPFADTIELLYLVRILHGLSFGFAATALSTIAAVIVPKKRQGEGIGYYLLSITLAAAIGPLVAILMQEHLGMNWIFIVNITLAVIGWFLTRFVTEQPPTPLHKRSVRAKGWRAFLEPSALPIALVSFLLFVAYASIIGFFSAYMIEIGLTEAGAVFFFVYSTAILVTRPFTGRLSDRKGLSFVIYPSIFLFGAALAWFSTVTHGWEVLCAAAVMGFGFGTFFAAAQTRAIRGLPNDRIGVATTTFLGISELGSGFGPFLLGIILPMIGYSGIYQVSAVICLIAGAAYALLYGRKKE